MHNLSFYLKKVGKKRSKLMQNTQQKARNIQISGKAKEIKNRKIIEKINKTIHKGLLESSY